MNGLIRTPGEWSEADHHQRFRAYRNLPDDHASSADPLADDESNFWTRRLPHLPDWLRDRMYPSEPEPQPTTPDVESMSVDEYAQARSSLGVRTSSGIHGNTPWTRPVRSSTPSTQTEMQRWALEREAHNIRTANEWF